MNKRENKMKIVFDSRSENEGFARMVASAFILELDPTLEEMNDFKTAVSEAVSNCVIHAYNHGDGDITMEIRTFILDEDMENKGYIETVISDSGCGIMDIEKAMEPLYTTKPEEERSGMGFAFMEAFMDELRCESVKDVGTTIYMKKYIKVNERDNEV